MWHRCLLVRLQNCQQPGRCDGASASSEFFWRRWIIQFGIAQQEINFTHLKTTPRLNEILRSRRFESDELTNADVLREYYTPFVSYAKINRASTCYALERCPLFRAHKFQMAISAIFSTQNYSFMVVVWNQSPFEAEQWKFTDELYHMHLMKQLVPPFFNTRNANSIATDNDLLLFVSWFREKRFKR